MSSFGIEYIVKQKCEGKALLHRILLIFSYIIIFALASLAVIALSSPVLYIPFFLLIIAFVALLIFISWRFVCVEYELALYSGELSLSVIYGKNTRRRLLSLPVSTLREVGEYDGPAYGRISKLSLQRNYILVSSLAAPRIFYALFDIGEDKCILYFEASDSLLAALKTQNSAAFRAGGIK